MGKITTLFLLVLFTTFSYADSECEVESWKSKRLSQSYVSVQGLVSKPFKFVSVEVYRHRTLIGTKTVRSNARGVFLAKVHTSKKAYKRPQAVVTCFNN